MLTVNARFDGHILPLIPVLSTATQISIITVTWLLTQWSLNPSLKDWVGHLAPIPERMLVSLLPLKRTLLLCSLASPSSLAVSGSPALLLFWCPRAQWVAPLETRLQTPEVSNVLLAPLSSSAFASFPPWVPLESIHFSPPPRYPDHISLGSCRAQLVSSSSLSLLPSPQWSFTSYCLCWEHFHDLSGRLKSGPPKDTCILILGTIVCYLAAIAVQLLSHV